tara:strand:- start:4243 stop:6093 length:1851 start_codon:yes stop_codon:yes gene_type:complete
MADKTFFGRLKKAFSTSTVVRQVGDKKLKVVDPSRLQSAGNLASNSLVDRFNRIHSSNGHDSVYNPSNAFAQMRLELFSEYESMDSDSIISSALDIYSDESTIKNEFGDILKITADKEEIKDILHNLFYDVLNIEFNLWPWIRNMVKYGDCYLKMDILEKVGVTGVQPISVYEVIREEGTDPSKPEYVRFLHDPSFGGASSNYHKPAGQKTYFENYEIAHFRMLSDTNFLPYGKSILEGGRKTWKQLTLMEDAMMIHRIMRAPSKRVFNIDIGNIPPAEVDNYMQQVINRMKKTPYIDQNTGDYNLKFNLQNMLEDFYLPTRGGNSGTKIEDLGGLEWTGTEDIEYLKNRMLASLRIPKAFVGYEEGVDGKATLAALDVRFARTVERIQRIAVSELTKIALVHLYTQGYTDADLVGFSIELTNPSTIAEQEKVELWSSKNRLADEMKTGQMLSEDWIYDKIFGMSKEEVKGQREKVVEDTIQNFRKEKISSEGIDPAKEPTVAEEARKRNKQTQLRASGDTRKTRGGKTDNDVGRPVEGDYYGTDNGARGRDPLGKEKNKRDMKNRDRGIKHTYKGNSPLAKEIANSIDLFKNKRSILKEKTDMLDESNLIDKDLT